MSGILGKLELSNALTLANQVSVKPTHPSQRVANPYALHRRMVTPTRAIYHHLQGTSMTAQDTSVLLHPLKYNRLSPIIFLGLLS